MGPSAGRAEGAPITGRLQFLITYVLVPLAPGLAVGYLTLLPATQLRAAGHRLDAPAVAGPGRAPGGPSDSGRGGGRDAHCWPARAGAVRIAGGTYGIAREATVDPASSLARRAVAIAVIAKSGSRNDFAWLASFLANQPEPVKQAALDALRHLDARLRQQDAPLVTNDGAPISR